MRLILLAAVLAPLLVASASVDADGQTVQKGTRGLAAPKPLALTIMIRSLFVTINDANHTGNYAVLRALAAPGFQSKHSPARLAEIFANLRKRKINLTPVVLYVPKLHRQPVVTNDGLLSLTGYFDTLPERVNFDLLYQPVEGQWRLFGITVKVETTAPKQATADRNNQKPARTAASIPAVRPKSATKPNKKQAQAQQKK